MSIPDVVRRYPPVVKIFTVFAIGIPFLFFVFGNPFSEKKQVATAIATPATNQDLGLKPLPTPNVVATPTPAPIVVREQATPTPKPTPQVDNEPIERYIHAVETGISLQDHNTLEITPYGGTAAVAAADNNRGPYGPSVGTGQSGLQR